jgi:hypothetical protein
MTHLAAARKPPLSDPLSFLLPTQEETALLQVCLGGRETAQAVWQRWYDPASKSGMSLLKSPAVKKLRPLLFKAVQSHDLHTDKQGLTLLRTAYLKEELRSAAVRGICRDVLWLLKKEGMAPVVLKGMALAETVYSNPVLRHCHDIDLLLPQEEISRASGLLRHLGFHLPGAAPETKSRSIKMVHESELPIELHSALFEVPYYESPLPQILSRARTSMVAEVPSRILAAPDALLHVCGHASYSAKRPSLRWVTDAWFITTRHPDLDWDLLLERIRGSRLALPLSVMLRYLATDLHAPIPADFVERLCAAASRAKSMERQLALRGARAAGQGSLPELFEKAISWRDRALLMQWLLFPSPRYLSWVDQIQPSWKLAIHYVYRPLRFAAWQIPSFVRGLLQRFA